MKYRLYGVYTLNDTLDILNSLCILYSTYIIYNINIIDYICTGYDQYIIYIIYI